MPQSLKQCGPDSWMHGNEPVELYEISINRPSLPEDKEYYTALKRNEEVFYVAHILKV